MTGKIWIKTLRQAVVVIDGSDERNRNLTVWEIMQIIHCQKANAYYYQRFLRSIFPDGPFDDNRPVEDEQRRLM